MPDFDLAIDGDMSWGDYKKIVSDSTPFEIRAQLIEKYVRVQDADASIDDVPMRKVLGALKRLLNQAQDPNA
jgi:hypothetical protein